jgi:hypothetical protein
MTVVNDRKEMKMSTGTQAAAQRALADIDFAQAIVDGKEDYPEVHQAILADVVDLTEVSGYLNPQPLPPMPPDLTETFAGQWGVANAHLSALSIAPALGVPGAGPISSAPGLVG